MTLIPIHHVDADVAIIGSGFAGSLTALALLSRGRRVVVIERGRHPRFAIGESSTPLANLLIEEMADRYDLPRIRPFSKWGTWQRARPDVAGGLKRGFTFFFHEPDEPFVDTDEHRRQLLVAASPHDDIADTHWYRPDVDHALILEAQAAGAVYLDMTRLDRVRTGRRSHDARRPARWPVDSHHRAVCHRCQRPARISARRARPRRGRATMAAADARAVLALRRCRALGPPAIGVGGGAVSGR